MKAGLLSHLASFLTPDTSGNIVHSAPPAQFDNSAKLTTTGFVQRALGSLAGCDSSFTNISGNVSIPASDVGNVVILGGSSGYTVSLPSTAGLPNGTSITLYGQNGNFNCTLSAQSGQNIITTTAFAQTMTFYGGDIATFTVYSGNWTMTSGMTQTALARMPGFAASLATNGYQKLPSGLIIQWGSVSGVVYAGTTYSFPVAFPTGCLSMTMNDGGSGCNVVSGGAISASQFKLYAWNTPGAAGSAGSGVNYIAIGH